jgi:hypothetical protein
LELEPSYIAYCFSFAAFGLAGNSLGPMLPSLAAQAGCDTSGMTPIIMAGGIGGLAGAMISSVLPLRALVPFGLASLGLSYAAVPFSTSVATLTAVFATAATCAQAVAIGGHAQIARTGGQDAASRLNGINACFGVGSLLAPFFNDQMRSVLGGTRSYFAIAALLMATSAPFLVVRIGGSASHPQLAHAASPTSHGTQQLVTQLGGPTGVALTASILALVCFSVGAEVSYASWLYTHAVQGLPGLSGTAASGIVSTFWLAMTAGRLCAAACASRGVSPVAILKATLPLAVVGPALALWLPYSGEALTVGVGLSGLGLSTGFANSVALLARHVEPSGGTQSLIQLAACGGALLFAPLAGALAQHAGVGTSAFLWVAGACAVLDAGCFLLASRFAGRMGPAKTTRQ